MIIIYRRKPAARRIDAGPVAEASAYARERLGSSRGPHVYIGRFSWRFPVSSGIITLTVGMLSTGIIKMIFLVALRPSSVSRTGGWYL